MDKFIEENTEKKALLLGFKKLKGKINAEMLKHSKKFDISYKKALVLGENHVRLINEIIERSLDYSYALDIKDLNFVNNDKSVMRIWDIPIYVSLETDIIMLVTSAGNLTDLNNYFTQKPGSYYLTSKEINRLINDLPNSSKYKIMENK